MDYEEEKQRLMPVLGQISKMLRNFCERVPGLRERMNMDFEHLEQFPLHSLQGKVYLFEQQGAVFEQDLGIFDYLLRQDATPEELVEVLKATRTGKNIQSIIPLHSPHIGGLNARLTFGNYRPGIRFAHLGIATEDNGWATRATKERENVLLNSDFGEGMPLPDFCKLAREMYRHFTHGSYSMELTQERGEMPGGWDYRGYWIQNLSMGGKSIIQSKKSCL